MTLTIADVERWNAGDVREVFRSASSLAQAAQDAADEASGVRLQADAG